MYYDGVHTAVSTYVTMCTKSTEKIRASYNSRGAKMYCGEDATTVVPGACIAIFSNVMILELPCAILFDIHSHSMNKTVIFGTDNTPRLIGNSSF